MTLVPSDGGSDPIRILVVSSDSTVATDVRKALIGKGNVSVETVGEPSEAMAILAGEREIDCVVSDTQFPRTEGLTLLEAARPQMPSLPFFLLASEDEERSVNRAVSMGATEYLPAHQYEGNWDKVTELLLAAVRYDRTQQAVLEGEDQAEAIRDSGADCLGIVSEGTWEYVSESGLDFLGADGIESVEGETITEHFETRTGPSFETLIERIQSGQSALETAEGRLCRLDDEDVSVRLILAPTLRRPDPSVLVVGHAIDPSPDVDQDVTERKEREQRLREYKQAVESSKDLLAAVDEDLTFLFANQAYRNYHDIHSMDVQEATLPDVLSAAEFEEVQPLVETALQGRPVQTTVSRTHPENGERVLDVRLFPLEGQDGSVYGVGASMRDITADRDREAAIERESEFRRLMSSVNQSLVRTTNVEAALERVTDILGSSGVFSCVFTFFEGSKGFDRTCKSTEQLTEEQIRSIHTDGYLETVFEKNVLEMPDVTAEPFEHHDEQTPSHAGIAIALTHDGQRYGVLTVHLPPAEEYSAAVVDLLETIADDLSYFIANTKLRSEHKSFAEIVERIDDPVMLQNRDGTYRVVNSAVADFAGLSKEALIGTDESDFMDGATAETIAEMKDLVLRTETPRSYEVKPHFPGGRERSFATTRYPYYDEEGRLDGTIAICRDVTDLTEHQRQLQVLDRVLRHNVNNNMNVIRGYATMIREQAEGELADYAEKITDNSDQLLDIAHKQRKITEFLSDPDPVETLALGPLLERVATRVERTFPEATITMDPPEGVEVRALAGIEEAIEEVLRNSVVHATTANPNPLIDVDVTADSVCLRFCDENQPISQMDREVLNGEGTLSTLRHGSGLGLWLVKLIVDHSNGTVYYDTNTVPGNVVTIELQTPPRH